MYFVSEVGGYPYVKNYIDFDLSLFICNPAHLANMSINKRTGDRECSSLRNRLVSSAYCPIFHSVLAILIPLILAFHLIAFARISTTSIKSRAEMGILGRYLLRV
jgi:hypothetical protein